MFAMGVSELISSFHNADTAVLNQLIDHGDLALNWNGNIFYDDTAGLFPDRFVMQLGKPIRVQNLGGIKPVTPMALPAEHYQMHLHLQDICDRLTATSNISLGKPAESESTLGEMQMVNSSLQRVFEDHVAEVARQHVKIWDQVRWLVSQYGVGPDGEVKFRSTVPANENVFKSRPPDILRRRVQFVPTGLKQMSDMGTRVQIAVMIRNAMLGDPLVQSNVEAKMMLADDYLRALNYPHREELMGAIKRRWMLVGGSLFLEALEALAEVLCNLLLALLRCLLRVRVNLSDRQDRLLRNRVGRQGKWDEVRKQ
jgi:hypothetical protein